MKKVGRGWIVIEESTEEDDGTEETKSMEESVRSPQEDSKTTTSSQAPAPAPTQNSQKRKRSEPPESSPRKRINNSNAHIPLTPTDIISRISRLIRLYLDSYFLGSIPFITDLKYCTGDAGYTGNKKLPWSSLPEFLASKNLYITGFPSICLPEVNNDEVVGVSSPTHWKPAQRAAMEEAFRKDKVKIVSRSPGKYYF